LTNILASGTGFSTCRRNSIVVDYPPAGDILGNISNKQLNVFHPHGLQKLAPASGRK
jgi:hypothetical protein